MSNTETAVRDAVTRLARDSDRLDQVRSSNRVEISGRRYRRVQVAPERVGTGGINRTPAASVDYGPGVMHAATLFLFLLFLMCLL